MLTFWIKGPTSNWLTFKELTSKDLSFNWLTYKVLTFRAPIFRDLTFSSSNLQEANLQEADFRWSNLYRAKNLSFDQLSKVKTLYGVELDEELLISLRERYSNLFELPY
jgi:uncharacterized protein YjbI with pentapeptide repeats